VGDKSRGGSDGPWPGESLDARTIFGAPSRAPSPRARRFRSLTLVRAASARFDEGEPRGSLKIRLARMFEERRVESLRNRAGEAPHSVPGAQQDPYLYTFLAHDEGQFIGSLGVRLDSSQGLAADELYRDELTPLRDAGARLCEFVRLSVDMDSAPKRAVACLFHAAYLFAGGVCGCEYGVIEAPANHADFYRSALGFESIGEARINARVSTTEALLCVHLRSALDGLARVGGRPDLAAQEQTLFPFGFSPEETVGVVRRLAGLAASTLPVRSRS
jgi:predicted GNAT superfamily acetyltransferase